MAENALCNAIWRTLGLTLLDGIDLPAPQRGFMRCDGWRFDLFANSGG